MLIKNLGKALFVALGLPGIAFAQDAPQKDDAAPETSAVYAQGDAAPETSAVYAQNAQQKDAAAHKQAKPKQASEKSAKSRKKNRAPTRGEQLTQLYKRVGDLIEAQKSDQKGTALAVCRETLPLLGSDVAKDFALSLSLTCAGVYGENGRYDDELAVYDAIGQDGLSEETKSGLCLARSTALTKLLRYEEAKQVLQNCPQNSAYRDAIEGNSAELFMTMGDVPQAVAAYRKAIENSPKNEHALYGLATALARSGQWKEAYDQFLRGVERDPGFNFLKAAFFVPKAENDFQKAFLKLALQRYDEAAFYLRRYAAGEARAPYKAVGACALSMLENARPAKRDRYPVLLRKVRAAAIDASARYLAFADVEFAAQKSAHSDVWILDTQTGSAKKALSLDDVFAVDAQFVGNTTRLRVLGAMQRFELDAAAPEKGYYVFGNASRNLPLALTPSAEGILSISSSNKVNLAPWNADAGTAILAQAPDDAMRIALLNDNSALAFAGMSETKIADLSVSPDGAETDAVLPMQFDVRKIAAHPKLPIFAMGIQSGVLFVDKTAKPLALIGAPAENAGADLVAFDPTGAWMLVLSENTAEVVSVADAQNPLIARWTCRAGEADQIAAARK